jgi:hypothetical protein
MGRQTHCLPRPLSASRTVPIHGRPGTKEPDRLTSVGTGYPTSDPSNPRIQHDTTHGADHSVSPLSSLHSQCRPDAGDVSRMCTDGEHAGLVCELHELDSGDSAPGVAVNEGGDVADDPDTTVGDETRTDRLRIMEPDSLTLALEAGEPRHAVAIQVRVVDGALGTHHVRIRWRRGRVRRAGPRLSPGSAPGPRSPFGSDSSCGDGHGKQPDEVPWVGRTARSAVVVHHSALLALRTRPLHGISRCSVSREALQRDHCARDWGGIWRRASNYFARSQIRRYILTPRRKAMTAVGGLLFGRTPCPRCTGCEHGYAVVSSSSSS